jgi:hypothetical protein
MEWDWNFTAKVVRVDLSFVNTIPYRIVIKQKLSCIENYDNMYAKPLAIFYMMNHEYDYNCMSCISDNSNYNGT